MMPAQYPTTTPEMREFSPGYYVTSDGRVFSRRRGRLIEMRLQEHLGYKYIRAFLPDGRRVTWRINRAVAFAWIGPPPSPRHEARHKDGNSLNNTVDNLAWATTKENAADKSIHGTQARGVRHGEAKLTDLAVAEIRTSTDPDAVLAERFGVSIWTVISARRGRWWRHIDVPPQRRKTNGKPMMEIKI